nr:NADH dehydrogenase subunit 1 [Pseudoacanthocephalus sp.]
MCNIVVLVLLVMLLLGYFTLLERKLLGYGQMRKGPNKGVVWGLLQPLLDGIKLFMKGAIMVWSGTIMLSFLGGGFGLGVVLMLWWLSLGLVGHWGVVYGMVLIIVFSGVVSVLYFVVGFLSMCSYGGFGSVRSLAMVLTYEGVMFFSLVGLYWGQLGGTLSMGGFSVVSLALLLALLLGMVVESGRTPTDFVEGESELVSGLTTEMGGLVFSFLFMLEYGVMGAFACIWTYLVVGLSVTLSLKVSFIMVGVMCLFNWLRMTLPRSRYDLVMEWGWKVLLVVVFGLLLLMFSFSWL